MPRYHKPRYLCWCPERAQTETNGAKAIKSGHSPASAAVNYFKACHARWDYPERISIHVREMEPNGREEWIPVGDVVVVACPATLSIRFSGRVDDEATA